MAREDMPDVIVLLPGITGSRLIGKDGRIIWGFSAGTLARILLTRGRVLERDLFLSDDPIDRDDLDDDIVADALIPDLHLLPGLWKIDGYTRVAEMIKAGFKVEEGKNFFTFPYDWRRDNRVSARKLARATHEWLESWRASSGNTDARLILVAHSMGGLVARYFLECLEGWRVTRALITFGTPYRGSLNALDTLANGLCKGPMGLIDLTSTARSFTAIYQLLPIYPCYDVGDGNLLRVGETSGIPNVDSEKAAAALAFHREIEAAVEANRKATAYLDAERGYRIYPVIGIAQPTNQSARPEGKGIRMLRSYEGEDLGGDGTVPQVSAEPIEFTKEAPRMFAGTQHGSLQNADAVLIHLRGLINRFYFDLGEFRWGEKGEGVVAAPVRVALDVPDLLFGDEPLPVRVRPEQPGVGLRVVVRSSGDSIVHEASLWSGADDWMTVDVPPLLEGAYTVCVTGTDGHVEPVESAVAVAGIARDD